MPQVSAGNSSKYWRSLDELADTPQFRSFVEKEFANYAPELLTSPTRRQFMKIMGASMALAGLAGCRWPKENILPYTKRPTGRVMGQSVHYATAMELGGVATGILVTSYDGRPIKVEGNPEHPFSKGRTSTFAQASVLELYDPDRSGAVRTGGAHDPSSWAAFEKFARDTFAAAKSGGGANVAILAEPSSSPTFNDLRDRFLKAYPEASWVEYEPAGRLNEKAGTALAFGKPLRPQYDISKADLIVCLDADFLLNHPTWVRNTLDFSARRTAADGKMNRLIVVESDHTITGGMADKRYMARPSDIARIAAALGSEIGSSASSGGAGDSERIAREIAGELKSARGRSLILAGERQPAEVHALAHSLNSALGNIGQTVSYTEEPGAPQTDVAQPFDRLSRLVDDMKAAKIETLLILGGNPVYSAPADLDFAEALKKVKTSIHLSGYHDETSSKCTWHLPQAHYLESWGDARAWDGTVSIIQPLIEPLLQGRTAAEVLALCSGDDKTSAYDLTRRTFEAGFRGNKDFETAWRHALHNGLVPDTAWKAQTPTLGDAGWAAALTNRLGAEKPADGNTYEVCFRPDYKVYDGRFANNAWLQELPDSVAKTTWDNAALISPADAARLGIERDDIVEISLANRSIQLPCCPVPGHAPGAITLTLGYGRDSAGVVARGAGVSVYPLRTRATRDFAGGARLTPTGKKHHIAVTQDHHEMRRSLTNPDTERRINEELFRDVSLAEHMHHTAEPEPAGAHKELPIIGTGPTQPDYNYLTKEFPYDQYKWGMLIDLSKCTGCSACVIACQAENNIPVVGRGEVALGREMHWIRIDRYFTGDPAAPKSMVAQPIPCMQCENAPCETVCPVAATTHDHDGLNVMVYNRCVGTRYCNNNCPYKVRRFNWFWNHHGPKHPRRREDLTEIEKMVFNPEVTMRSRGVMEKCTYCVQRLERAKIEAKNEVMRKVPEWQVAQAGKELPKQSPKVPEAAVITACAQACPAEAIVFGDLNDEKHRITQMFRDRRRYSLLEELNTQPRTQYLYRLRNRSEGAAPAAHGAEHAG